MKNRLIRISPSILCLDYNNDIVLKLALDKIEQSGAHMVHLDVMDGKFVPRKTFDHKLVDKIKDMTSLMLDVHLMVENPHNKKLGRGRWNSQKLLEGEEAFLLHKIY